MRLISARLAWHDAFYTPWDSVTSHSIELAKLGQWVQTSSRGNGLGRIAHQALAGKVQHAIASLPVALQLWGHHLYAPVIDSRTSNAWEEAAVDLLESQFNAYLRERGQQLATVKRAVLGYVARGVLYRYRVMVQGGMGANPDPLPSPREFRAWLADWHGVQLDRRNWSREWGWVVQEMFRACDRLDAKALWTVAGVLEGEKALAA